MLERGAWVFLALVHAPPFAALFSPGLITRLYGVGPADATFPLLQHRAALFGVIFIACLWAAAAADASVSRLVATVVALSMLSFLAIYWAAGMPASLKSIALADLIGLPALGYVVWRAFLGD